MKPLTNSSELGGQFERNQQASKRPSINIYECGLKDGDELVYIHDLSVKAYVHGEHKVLYNEELTSLSAIVRELKHAKSISDIPYFTFYVENLSEKLHRTQWKGL